jgi:murein L,D-transpeptidase YafK
MVPRYLWRRAKVIGRLTLLLSPVALVSLSFGSTSVSARDTNPFLPAEGETQPENLPSQIINEDPSKTKQGEAWEDPSLRVDKVDQKEVHNASGTATDQDPLVPQVFTGPSRPIGHLLDSPEDRQRIARLLEEKVRVAVSSTPSEVDSSLPPLIGGRYGFDQPSDLSNGVPAALVQLGAAGPRYALVVEKLHHRLSIFQSDQGSPIKLVKTFRAITGKNPEDKTTRGDLRTPEGVYFVDGRLPDQALPPKYGRLALTLDYPNVFDRLERKSGYGIWLHATDDPKRLLKPFDTEGCIAVSNEDVLEIERYITPGVTPLIITKEMTLESEERLAQDRQDALRMLESWRQAWKDSRLEQYIEFYSADFRHKRMDKASWKDFKNRLARARPDIDVKISDPTIVAIDGQLVVNFLQEYVSDGHSDFGIKSLYLRWEGERYRIVSEHWRPLQKTETALQQLQRPEGQL